MHSAELRPRCVSAVGGRRVFTAFQTGLGKRVGQRSSMEFRTFEMTMIDGIPVSISAVISSPFTSSVDFFVHASEILPRLITM